MKCAVCSHLEDERYYRLLKENKLTERYGIPEATASFKGSNGMTIYICNQHITANIVDLDDLVVKRKERQYSF